MTRSTRNLEELMKTQVVNTSDDTVNRALKMSEELQVLRKENQKLKADQEALQKEREQFKQKIKSLESELRQHKSSDTTSREKKLLDDLKTMQKGFDALYDELAEMKSERDDLQTKLVEREDALASAKAAAAAATAKAANTSDGEGHSPTQEELRLAEQVRRLQISCDSLFGDLDKVKKERDELKAVIANAATTSKRPSPLAPSKSSMLSWMTSSMTKNVPESNDDSGQASFLMRAVERHGSTAPSTSSNPMERKLQELEVENLKLKSTIVHLQSQYKEERYKNQQLQQHGNSEENSVNRSSTIIRQPTRSMSLQVPMKSFKVTRKNDSDDEDDEGDYPSPLADEPRSVRKIQSLRKLPSPKRSASLRRIHEYKAKKDPSVKTELTSVTTVDTVNTGGTSDDSADTDATEPSTTSTASSLTPAATTAATTEATQPAKGMPGGLSQRPNNLLPTSSFNSKPPNRVRPNNLVPTSSFNSKPINMVSEAISSSNKIPLKRNNSNKLTWGRSPARNMQQQETQRVLNSHPAYRQVNRTRSGEIVTSLGSSGPDGPKRTPSLIGMIWGGAGGGN